VAKAVHSFRGGKGQAKLVAAEMARHGESRHAAKISGDKAGVQGLGTERISRQVMGQYAEWLHQERRGDLRTATREAATHYLEQRAEAVSQSTLNQERQALDRLQRHLHGPGTEALPRVRSELETIKTGRAYTAGQLAAICSAQTPRNALMTELSARTSIRAHESYSLRRASSGEQPASSHRTWSADRFKGANGSRPDGELYTVKGKGGLVRQVLIPRDLATRLEEGFRLAIPELVRDRGIFYVKNYGVGGGQAWSQSFSAASKRVLNFSAGGHGCRHSYAQNRLAELQAAGWEYRAARLVVSQEMGHFRESVIDAYLR